ncbi:MAG: hypothetical protein O2912_02585 [Proteobacteria bacterium]|nr:hypothetical protein [Pseudomonadota bacterium]
MTDVATEDLIKSMIDSKKLGSDTVDDLKDFLKDIKDGSFHKDDDAYVHALADRLGLAGGKAKSKSKSPKSAPGKSDNVDWHERAVIAEARVDDLEEEIEDLKSEIETLKKKPQQEAGAEPTENSVDIDELRPLITKLYDAEKETLRDISNEDAAATLKEISQKLE